MSGSETRADQLQHAAPKQPPQQRNPKLILAFVDTKAERTALENWLLTEREDGERAPEMLEATDPFLGVRLRERGDDPEVVPVRVAWLPIERTGATPLRVKDLLTLSNPRRPRQRTQQRILRTHPDRVRILQGASARVSDMGRRFREITGGGDEQEFGAFVRRQGVLALARAERGIIGERYKAARMVPEEVLSSARLRKRLETLANQLGRTTQDVGREARRYLQEMAAEHSELAIDAWETFIRFVVRQYSIDVQSDQLTRLRRLGSRRSLAYLPSHRSYLDPFILRTVLHQHGLPPNHVLGGINVSFWPMGTFARRSGIVFIRRSYKDKPVYSVVLREYITYLIRKRFNLEWYIEGGRTRTGKLRPPRYGILAYIVDAVRQGEDDVYFVPTAIVYDQLPEVGDIANEDQGGEKPRESFTWMIDYLRRQAQVQGTAYVRFGEPLSLREAIVAASGGGSENGQHPPEAKPDLTVEKIAFEVMHRINRATPVTPAALVTTALLGIGDRALTLGELRHVLSPVLDYVRRREVPITEDILERADGLATVLEKLERAGLVTLLSGGAEDAWTVSPARHLEASFYRNSIVHYFLDRAIVELVAIRAAEEPFEDPEHEAWRASLQLRDLLKFEFFFAGREEFATELRAELAAFDPEWETRGAEQEKVWDHLTSSRLFVAHRVLGPYIQAYYVVADRLAAHDPAKEIDEKEFLKLCIGTARQYRAQQRIWASEAISKELFSNALRLADNRGLLAPGGDDLLARRKALATELRILLFRVRRIRDLAVRDLDVAIEGWPSR